MKFSESSVNKIFLSNDSLKSNLFLRKLYSVKISELFKLEKGKKAEA